MVIIVTVVWVVCGILAYGIDKNYWREFYLHFELTRYHGYDDGDELACITLGILGPIGLFDAFFWALEGKYRLGLCFRMPKELCKPRRSS